MKLVLAFGIFIASIQAFTWGGRGHNTICEVAVHLVKDTDLKEFLQSRPHMMGHLCNVPDIYWKSLDGDAHKYGDPTHYLDPEILGLKVKDIPLDFKKIVADYTNKPNAFKKGGTVFSIPGEFGSNWWRADQFMRRIAARKEAFSKVVVPEGKKDFDDEAEFNKLVYATMLDMGLMGHFVGDNGQPFHATADYDGWMAGHGGIHSYYEEAAVAAFDGDLPVLILKKARATLGSKEAKTYLEPATTLEKMRALAVLSNAEMELIFKKDPILEKSEQKEEKGMFIHIKPAKRKPGADGMKAFQDIIVTDMSRSALLLAKLWDESFESIGKPKFKAYRSYKYPFTPEFIMPDYITVAESKETSSDKK